MRLTPPSGDDLRARTRHAAARYLFEGSTRAGFDPHVRARWAEAARTAWTRTLQGRGCMDDTALVSVGLRYQREDLMRALLSMTLAPDGAPGMDRDAVLRAACTPRGADMRLTRAIRAVGAIGATCDDPAQRTAMGAMLCVLDLAAGRPGDALVGALDVLDGDGAHPWARGVLAVLPDPPCACGPRDARTDASM